MKCFTAPIESKIIGDLSRLDFTRVTFWLQLHNLLIVCITKDIALFLGLEIGRVKDFDLGSTGECLGPFIRIRMIVDTTKPLE